MNYKSTVFRKITRLRNFICTCGRKEINKNNLISYIYLIQERENVEKNNNIYKFGQTTQVPNNKINILQRYKKGSHILLILECDSNIVKALIQNIKINFNWKFKKHTDGNQDYIGDKHDMMKIISSLICKK